MLFFVTLFIVYSSADEMAFLAADYSNYNYGVFTKVMNDKCSKTYIGNISDSSTLQKSYFKITQKDGIFIHSHYTDDKCTECFATDEYFATFENRYLLNTFNIYLSKTPDYIAFKIPCSDSDCSEKKDFIYSDKTVYYPKYPNIISSYLNGKMDYDKFEVENVEGKDVLNLYKYTYNNQTNEFKKTCIETIGNCGVNIKDKEIFYLECRSTLTMICLFIILLTLIL